MTIPQATTIGICGGCGRTVTSVRWDRELEGVVKVGPQGVCCSLFEGDYPLPDKYAHMQVALTAEHIARHGDDSER